MRYTEIKIQKKFQITIYCAQILIYSMIVSHRKTHLIVVFITISFLSFHYIMNFAAMHRKWRIER